MQRSRLPVEVCERVIDYVDYSPNLNATRTTLHSCLCTCRAWVPRARYHLYTHVLCNTHHDISLLLQTLCSRPDDAKLVRSLSLGEPMYYSHRAQRNHEDDDNMMITAALHLSRVLAGLRHITIAHLEFHRDIHTDFFRFLSQFDSVTRLSLGGTVFASFFHFERVVLAFRNLKYLSLSETSWTVRRKPVQAPPGHIAHHHSRRRGPTLECVRILGRGKDDKIIKDAIDWLLTTPTVSSLAVLSVGPLFDIESISAFKALTMACRDTLHTLDIRCSTSGGIVAPIDELDLVNNLALRDLRLHGVTQEYLPNIISFLDHAGPRSMRSFSLHVLCSDDILDAKHSTWSKLISALSRKHFPDLERVGIKLMEANSGMRSETLRQNLEISDMLRDLGISTDFSEDGLFPPPSYRWYDLPTGSHRTSYANSVLQALYFCNPFRELVIQYPDPSVPDVLPLPSASPVPPILIPTPLRPKPSRKGSVLSPDSPLISSTSQRPASATQPSSSVPVSMPTPVSPPTLLSALGSLYMHTSKNPADRGMVPPNLNAFMDKLKQLNEMFRSTQRQDAHEFLSYLLNRIVEEIEGDRRNGTVSNGTAGDDLLQSVGTLSSVANGSTSDSHPALTDTFMHRLFEGVLMCVVRCLTCETVSVRDESFLDLSIDIEQNSSVTACLRQFSAIEMLCQRNKFFCDSCSGLQEAEKRMEIKKLPNVLALHLKRFKYQEDTGRYIKLTYRVAFPFHLRLFNAVDDAEDPDRLYELFGIVAHIGAGPHHGHFVSIIKTRGSWLLFDDDTVEEVKEADIPKYFGDSGTNNGSAYILYYQAVDLDVAALGEKIAPSPPPVTV